jgi:hypothetical protein
MVDGWVAWRGGAELGPAGLGRQLELFAAPNIA